MKFSLRKLLIALIVAIMLVGCGSSQSTDDKKPADDKKAGQTTECKVRIGLVTDTGGVDDKSFNQSSWEGVQRWAKEANAEKCIKYLQSNSDSDYVPNLSQLVDDKYDLVIATGYLFQKAIDKVAADNPNAKFLFIDGVSEKPNVESAVFNAEEGSFLVGLAAGVTATENGSKKVGFVGGEEGEIIGKFQAGYEQGVLAACPDCTIYVDYAASFVDDSRGQQMAVKQYDLGATVIYQAAGNAGNGVIKEAKERQNVWAIGVDRDQYEDGKVKDKSVILTSMLKRVDTAAYSAAKAVAEGTFKPGLKVFDLKIDGVGAELSTGRNLNESVIKLIKDYEAKIKSGELKIDPKPKIGNGKTNK